MPQWLAELVPWAHDYSWALTLIGGSLAWWYVRRIEARKLEEERQARDEQQRRNQAQTAAAIAQQLRVLNESLHEENRKERQDREESERLFERKIRRLEDRLAWQQRRITQLEAVLTHHGIAVPAQLPPPKRHVDDEEFA